jgi:hypothetical protein
MQRTSWLAALVVGSLALLSCGCSGGGSKITGSVTLESQPLSGATVVFLPVGDKYSPGERTKTGADGKFTIIPRKGATEALAPGKYVVLITRMVDKNGKVPSDEQYGMMEMSGELHNQLPDKYNDKNNPQAITVDIQAGDNDLKPFDVKKK